MNDRWWSKMVRWLLGSQWDRTFVVYNTFRGTRLLVAGLFGVVMLNADEVVKHGITVVSFEPVEWSQGQRQSAVERVLHNDMNRRGIFGFLVALAAFQALRLMGKKGSLQPVMSGLILDYFRGGEGGEWEYMDKRKMRPQDLFVEISARRDFSFLIGKA